MKKTLSLILCLISITITLCSCSNFENFTKDDNLAEKYKRNTNADETYNYNDGVIEPPTTYLTYSSQITDFELRMFRNYHKTTNNRSYVFCPINSVLQLELTANGASKNTRDEILNTLCKSLKLEAINQCSSYFKSRLEAVADKYQSEPVKDDLSGKTITNTKKGYVKLLNNLFFNDTADIRTKFLQTDKDYYNTDIFRFAFNNDMITKVNNQFKSFGTSSAFSKLESDDNLISATASDICDLWLNAYAKTDLEKGSFSANGNNKNVTYMVSNEIYSKSDKAQAVIKYTAKTPLKLMAVIPNDSISLDEYISDFTNLEFSNLIENIDFTKNATVKLPEFSIASQEKAVDITTIIENSGMYSLFTDKATFGELTHTDNFRFNAMYEISPKISVNACGIGGVQTNGDSPALSERINKLAECDVSIEFNRPFIFLILDNESNIPIYIGTVNN